MPLLDMGYIQVLFIVEGLIVVAAVIAILLRPGLPFRPGSSTQRDAQVLIVEDNEAVRRELRVAFRRRGIAVVAEAANFDQAVAAAGSRRPDVVVMDLRLPQGSGAEACRAIRARVPGARVILLTSAPEEEASRVARNAGAAAYLLKPVSSLRVAEAVEQLGRIAAGFTYGR